MATHFMPGESYGQRGLVGCSPWGHRVGHNRATNATTTHSKTQVSLCLWVFPSIWIYIWALPLPCSGSRFLCFSSSSEHHTSQGCFPLIHMTKWIDCLCLWRNYPTPPLSLHSLSLPVFFLSFMHYRQILYCLNHQGSPYQISGTLYFPRNFSYNIPLGISWPWVRQTWYC